MINNALGQGGTHEFFALMSTPWDNMTLRTASPPPFTAYHIGMSSCNHSDKYNKLLAEGCKFDVRPVISSSYIYQALCVKCVVSLVVCHDIAAT